MNRYIYYHFLVVCFTNLILLIPYYLVSERFQGAVMAILISPLIGGVLLYMYTSGLRKFPGNGLPEIFSMFYPRWFVRLILAYKLLISMLGVILVVAVYVSILTRFLNPDTDPLLIMFVLLVISLYGATRSSTSVNFIVEIFTILSTPLVFFILYKMLRSPILNWDSIRIVANHTFQIPSILAISCSLFIYTGFTNLSIFNRLFPANFKFKLRWAMILYGFINLSLCFFLPIGINGTASVSDYLYIWTASSDSIRMEFGFIERALFVFLLALMGIGFAFIVVAIHITIQYIWAMLPKDKVSVNPESVLPIKHIMIISLAIIGICLLIRYILLDMHYVQYGGYYLIIRFFCEVGETLWLYILSKKKVRNLENYYAS